MTTVSSEICRLRDECAVDEETGCWIPSVVERREKYGYVEITVEDGRTSAHRAAHLEWIGPIEPGHYVRHTCDARDCFNPAHLFTSPPKERKIPKRVLKGIRDELRAKLEGEK